MLGVLALVTAMVLPMMTGAQSKADIRASAHDLAAALRTTRNLAMTQGRTEAFVVDTAIGLTPRVQLGASVPRVAGGLGTMFFSTKVAVFSDDVRALKVAVGPTLEILTEARLPGQRRAEWGVPVSAQIDRGSSRIYGGTGYFSPGIWFETTDIKPRPPSAHSGIVIASSPLRTSKVSGRL